MKNKPKVCNLGVSLISLIITIVVIVIIAGITMDKWRERTEEARAAKHNTNISITQEEVENYYYYHDEKLPVVNLTPYGIAKGSTLDIEITKNGEQSETFYVLDLAKLNKVSGKDGTGVEDDIFIVSSEKHSVYYVKGVAVKGYIYHGLIK